MIGGNIDAMLQVKHTAKNQIGESVIEFVDVIELRGWLDMSSGESKYVTYNTKMQESTHIFMCDYVAIPDTKEIKGKDVKVRAESTRLVVNSKPYDVLLIDNPLGLNKQIEIYLKFTGGD